MTAIEEARLRFVLARAFEILWDRQSTRDLARLAYETAEREWDSEHVS